MKSEKLLSEAYKVIVEATYGSGKISQDKLVGFLVDIKGATPVTIEAETVPSGMRKTGNPFVGVKKHSTVNGIIGFNYERSVQNQQARQGMEPDFQAQGRTADYEHLGGAVYQKVNKVGQMNRYLWIKIEHAGTPTYTLNGKDLTSDEVTSLKTFIREPSPAYTQLDAGVAEGSEIIPRMYSMNNIKRMRVKGFDFVIDNEETAPAPVVKGVADTKTLLDTIK